MAPDTITLSPDGCNAHMLATVMDATAAPGETAEAARARRGMIVELFRAFDPANAMEAMIACHCISLQFVLNAAMRDAGNLDLNPAVLIRARGSAMAISKTLHLWVSKYEAIHKRDETRATQAPRQAPRQGVPAVTAPAAAEPPPPRPVAPQPPAPTTQDSPAIRYPGAQVPGRAAPGMKEALLASVATLSGAAPNGRLRTAPVG
jgi:hypothetical protein